MEALGYICLTDHLVVEVTVGWGSKPTTEYYRRVAYAWGTLEYIFPVWEPNS